MFKGGEIMDNVSDSILEFIISNLCAFIGVIVQSLFSIIHNIFEILYPKLQIMFTDSYVEDIGSNFFDTVFSKAKNISLSFNVIYWIVGVYISIFIIKHIAFPIIVALVDNVHDLFISWINPAD